MSPAEIEVAPAIRMEERVRSVWKRYKWFTIVVLAPTLIAATYLYGVAANQYVSEAHFIVRSQSLPSSSSGSGGSSGSLSSMLGGGSSSIAAVAESLSIADYMTSHDAVDALQKRLNLVALFRRPETDLLSRLSKADPTPENLLKFYNRQVNVDFDPDNGITTLQARAFRPADAHSLAAELLQLGEHRVNELNVRAYRDAVALSKRQLDEAEAAMRANGSKVTAFRQAEGDANPETSAGAQIGLVSGLRMQLSAAQAQLNTTVSLIGSKNPQTQALRQQVSSLEKQIASQESRLAGGGNAIAAGLGNYEAMQQQQEFLQQRYASASTAYEGARQQAIRQQLYVVRIVDANMPVMSTFPKRGFSLLTLFAALAVIYAIGWLIAAGVREHSV